MLAKNALKIFQHNEVSVKYAKPSRDLVKQFGTGELHISGSTMNLLMYISPFVDLEGKVIIDMEQAKYDLYMQQGTLERSVKEAISQGLLVKREENYYSKFHIHTDGKTADKRYIKIIKAFSSPEVSGYSLRTKRLFYYLVSAKRMGDWHQVHIENLYNNRLKRESTGVNYFDSFKEVTTALLALLNNGHIEIRLPQSNAVLLKKDTKNVEGKLLSFLGITVDSRKSRTSLRTSRNRVLNIRIADTILRHEQFVMASEVEIKALTNKFNIPFSELKKDSIHYLISYKNDLFKIMGEAGLSIYRKALTSFVSKHSYDLQSYDNEDKLANYFMDYYLLDEIQKVLLSAAVHQKIMGSKLSLTTPIILSNNYKTDFFCVGGLLSYFLKKSSIHQIILFDEALNQKQVNYNDILFSKRIWQQLEVTANQEYQAVQQILLTESKESGTTLSKNAQDVRVFVRNCARESMLVRRETVLRWIDAFPVEEIRVRAPVFEHKLVPKPVPLYNWLEERD